MFPVSVLRYSVFFLYIATPRRKEQHSSDKDTQLCPPGADCESVVFLSGDDNDSEEQKYKQGGKTKGKRNRIGPEIKKDRIINRNPNSMLRLMPYIYHRMRKTMNLD
mgnify:FL=1